MTPVSEGVIAIVVAGVGLAGQVMNYILHLRIRAAILESEKRTLDEVHEEYLPRELCFGPCRAKAKTSSFETY